MPHNEEKKETGGAVAQAKRPASEMEECEKIEDEDKSAVAEVLKFTQSEDVSDECKKHFSGFAAASAVNNLFPWSFSKDTDHELIRNIAAVVGDVTILKGMVPNSDGQADIAATGIDRNLIAAVDYYSTQKDSSPALCLATRDIVS